MFNKYETTKKITLILYKNYKVTDYFFYRNA